MGFDLIITIITSFAIFFIGFLVYFHDRKSFTNLLFFLISISTVLWAGANYFSVIRTGTEALPWIRLVLFFAIPHVVLFFLFTKNFPKSKVAITGSLLWGVLAVMAGTMFLTLTPLIFESISVNGGRVVPEPGSLIPVLGIVIIGSLIGGIVTIVKKYRRAVDIEKRKWGAMLFGVSASYILLIITNFVIVNVSGDTRFVIFAPAFMLPAIIGMAYSILKYNLLNVKAIATEIFAFIILSISLIQIFSSDSTADVILSIMTFIVLFIFSMFLIRSVLKEVEQREELEIITKKLERANEKLKSLDKLKTEFLSLASHQLRSPLTAIKGYVSMLLEKEFGTVSEKQKEPLERIYISSNNLSKVVEDLLDVSKIEQGGMKYEFVEVDLLDLVSDLVEELSLAAEKRGLSLNLVADQGKQYNVSADPGKVRQVFLNLIDNAIKYTEKGSVTVSLNRLKDAIRVDVTDTGMGMSQDTKEELFKKFNRGKGGRINTSGSGLGLYLAKEIVRAHHGKIGIDSLGEGKGSTFSVELPIENEQ